MQDILQHPGLKKITLTKWIDINIDFSEVVDAELLTPFFSPKMEEIEICPMKCLLGAFLNKPNKLKRLILKGCVDCVDSVLLVTALNKIETLEVELLNADEANMLFKMMMQDGSSVLLHCLSLVAA